MDNRNMTRSSGKVVGQEAKVTKTGKTMYKVKFLMPDGREKGYWSWDDFTPYLGKEQDFDWWTEESTTPGGKPFYKCRFPSVINPPAPGIAGGFSVAGNKDEVMAKLDLIISMIAKLGVSESRSVPSLPPQQDPDCPF